MSSGACDNAIARPGGSSRLPSAIIPPRDAIYAPSALPPHPPRSPLFTFRLSDAPFHNGAREHLDLKTTRQTKTLLLQEQEWHLWEARLCSTSFSAARLARRSSASFAASSSTSPPRRSSLSRSSSISRLQSSSSCQADRRWVCRVIGGYMVMSVRCPRRFTLGVGMRARENRICPLGFEENCCCVAKASAALGPCSLCFDQSGVRQEYRPRSVLDIFPLISHLEIETCANGEGKKKQKGNTSVVAKISDNKRRSYPRQIFFLRHLCPQLLAELTHPCELDVRTPAPHKKTNQKEEEEQEQRGKTKKLLGCG